MERENKRYEGCVSVKSNGLHGTRKDEVRKYIQLGERFRGKDWGRRRMTFQSNVGFRKVSIDSSLIVVDAHTNETITD